MAAKKKPNAKGSNKAKPKDQRKQSVKNGDPAGALKADLERHQAIKMRLEGYTFREIADEIGISVSTAHTYVNDGWERVQNATDEDRTLLRDMELARCDQMLKRVLPIATANNLLVEKEKFVDGSMIVVTEEDAELQFKAVDRVLKIQKRRSDLLGLDAPTKIEQTGASALIPLDELAKRVAENKAKKRKG